MTSNEPPAALKTRVAITLLVLANLWVASVHGGAHDALEVLLPTEKQGFVWGTVVLIPVVAAGLIWTRFFRSALTILGWACIAAAIFGIYHHYVLISPDNIEHLPHGSHHDRGLFISSAGWLALLEATLAGVCLYLRGYWSHAEALPGELPRAGVDS